MVKLDFCHACLFLNLGSLFFMKKTILSSLYLFISMFALAQTNSTSVYATISPDSAQTLITYHYLDPNFVILDVRTEGEYDSKHIENGVNLNYYLSTFNDILDTLVKTKVYLIHCASGGRSGNVFNSMQTKGFENVYNLDGGLNAWENAGKPTLTSVLPILLSVSDTIVEFQNTGLSQNDFHEITITNYGNDTLDFTSITNLSLTEFSSDFNLSARLTGLMDYTFRVYYSPIDLQNDSVIFDIESSNRTLHYVLKGHATATNIEEHSLNHLSVYPNPSSGIIRIKNDQVFLSELFSINGEVLYTSSIALDYEQIDMTNYQPGIYLLKINSEEGVVYKKIILQ